MKKGAATTAAAASPPPFSDGRRRRRINNSNKSPSPSSAKDQLLLLSNNSTTPVLTPTAAMMSTPGKSKKSSVDDWQSVANAALSSASSTTSSRNNRSFSSTPRKKIMDGKKQQLQHTTPPSNHLSPSSVRSATRTPRSQKNEAAAAVVAENKNKRITIITPRTRARSIINTLASPGDLLLLTPTTTTTTMGGADLRRGRKETTKKMMGTPRHNSTAEATLHKLARMTSASNGKQQQPSHKKGEEEDDKDSGFPTPSQHTRRKQRKNNNNNGDTTMVVVAASAIKKNKRKAANDAQAKISTICNLDEYDDLDSLLIADTIVYNTEQHERYNNKRQRTYGSSSNSARDGSRSKKTTTIMEKNNSNTNKPPNSDNSINVDIIIEETSNTNDNNSSHENNTTKIVSSRGERRRKKNMTNENNNDDNEEWLHNFRKWRTLSSEGDLHTSNNKNNTDNNTCTATSSLPISWMNEQRTQYHKFQCGDKSSTMTVDRAALLEGAGFVWEVVGKNDNNVVNRSNSTRSCNDETVTKEKTMEEEELMTTVDQSVSPGGGVGRKSPRKSLPTQFYHNSLDAGTGKEDEKGGDTIQSTNTNSKKRQSKVISIAALRRFGAVPSLSASPIIPKKSKQQSKRTSPPESLASLPVVPDVKVKEDDDNKQKREEEKSSKKKKRRGRHSTSSLLSLDARSTDVLRNEEDKVLPSDGKGLVTTSAPGITLSHKELKEVLSKSKKKPKRQKKKMTSDDNKVTVGMTSNLLSEDIPHDDDDKTECGTTVEFEASAARVYDVSSSQSPVSPLRITRLLPALMNSDTTTTTTVSSKKKKNIAGGSLLKLSRKDAIDATVDAPSISQLLMSCLSSEDSAEKKKSNAKVHSPSGAKKLAASPLRRGCDMSTIENTSNEQTSPPADMQVAPHIDADTGKDDMPTPEKRKRGRPRKNLSSKEDDGDQSITTYPPIDEAIIQQEVSPSHIEMTEEENNDVPTPEKRKQGRPQNNISSKDGCNASTISAQAMASTTLTTRADDEYRVPQCTMVADKITQANDTNIEDTAISAQQMASTTMTKRADVEYRVPQCTMVADKITQTNDTNIEDTVADMEECFLDEKPVTQTNDANIEDTAATTTKALKQHCTIWTCDICRVAEFDDYFHAEEHEKECAIANNLQEIPPPSEEEYGRSRSPLSPLVEADQLQSPPSPMISPTHFSPVTLSSPTQTSHHRAATKSSIATSLVLGGENGQLSVPLGSQVRESSQRQMIVTQKIHAGLTEYGRLQLESQLVTQRMREIEEEIKLRSNKLSYIGDIDDIATSSRKRSYRAESRSASIKHHQHYEYSEEEYSDDYHSSRKRRRLNHVPDDYINEQRGYSGERSMRRSEMHISSSKARRSRSSRSGQRYKESEMEMGISHRSKKIERYRADRSYSPKSYRRGDKMQYVSRSNMPYETHNVIKAKKKLKGYNTETRDVTARPRQAQTIKQMNTPSKQYPRSSLEKASPADSYVSYELPRYSDDEEEESPLRSSKSRGKAHQRQDREPVSRAHMSSSVPNFEADTNYSVKASQIDSSGKSKGESTTIIPANSSNFQVIRTKDPMTWLAEEENSSDDESWDFDGPMILPPSPIF
jgi:hypothetical protein